MAAFRSLGFGYAWGYWVHGAPGSGEIDLQFGDLQHPWCRHYIERGWDKRSPIGQALGPRPVTWDEVRKRRLPASQARVFDELREFNLTQGHLVLVETQGERRCAVSLAGSDFEPRDEAARTAAHLLSLHYGFTGFHLLGSATESAAVGRPRLTSRQIECLRWVREGKTAWETGQILNLSSRTVEEHLAKACHKLGVRSRFQAVIEAARLGFFEL